MSIDIKEPSRKADEKKKMAVIKQNVSRHLTGNIIGKIASCRYFVHKDVLINEFSDDLIQNESITAVGVIDNNKKILGIVRRSNLFDMIGKQFGRDLYNNKKVFEIITKVKTFHYRTDIYTIAEELKSALNTYKNAYYMLVDRNDNFTGIFTTKDLRIYLSEMTRNDLELAKKIQSYIVRDEMKFSAKSYEIFCASKMASDVGGDFYSIEKILDGRWLFCVCDVSGKGMSAALVSTLLGGTIKFFDFNKGLMEYLKKLNKFIFKFMQNEKFITGTFVFFDQRDGSIELYDMGHSYTYILRNNNFIKPKTPENSMPLGIIEKIKPIPCIFTLKKGDLLIIITDGLEDQRNPRGENYNLKNILLTIKKYKKENLKQIKDKLFNNIKIFKENQSQNDDMTLFMIRYTGDK